MTTMNRMRLTALILAIVMFVGIITDTLTLDILAYVALAMAVSLVIWHYRRVRNLPRDEETSKYRPTYLVFQEHHFEAGEAERLVDEWARGRRHAQYGPVIRLGDFDYEAADQIRHLLDCYPRLTRQMYINICRWYEEYRTTCDAETAARFAYRPDCLADRMHSHLTHFVNLHQPADRLSSKEGTWKRN